MHFVFARAFAEIKSKQNTHNMNKSSFDGYVKIRDIKAKKMVEEKR